MPTTRESLEAALAEDPENVALHSAYADLLIEDGDPRGELIRLTLLAEDETVPESERARLAERQMELFERHEREWLGPLHRFVHADRSVKATWKRGWLDRVRIFEPDELILDALRRLPVIQLIDTMEIVDSILKDEIRTFLRLLNRVPFRTLHLIEFESTGDQLVPILDHNLERSRPFHLVLDRCGITDDGAHRLARSRLAADLLSVRLPRNHLSAVGVAALAEVGFAVEERHDNPGWGTDVD